MCRALSLLAFVTSLAICPITTASSPIVVDDRPQLFIDHRFIAGSEGVELHMNPAQKLGRITDEAGTPIRGHVSRVYDEDGTTRLYVGAEGLTVYESDDGMRFQAVGSIPSQGRVLPTVFRDPHEQDPAKRYKLFSIQLSSPPAQDTDGVYASYGSDGIHFSEPVRVFPRFTDNPVVVWWDGRIDRYVIYTRALALDSENQRRVARIETDDPLRPWPYTEVPLSHPFNTPENTDVVLQADELDDPYSDIYYNAATLYPFGQDVYLMFTAQFRHFSPTRQPFIHPREPGKWEDYGLLEVQLAVSRDGIRWQRPSREPYFATGLADEWDRWYAVLAPGMVRHGSYLYQYYVSTGHTHDSNIVRPEYANVTDLGGIGVVRQRRDGFVSADADYSGGWLDTPPLLFSGATLRLNIDTGAMGTAFVELRTPEGEALAGHRLEDCEEVGGNYINQTVYWNGQSDLADLAGQPIVLHFKLTRAKLYSFVFAN